MYLSDWVSAQDSASGARREHFRSRAAHVQIMRLKGFFYNKTYAAFCLTHFRLDYNLLTYICLALCTDQAAGMATWNGSIRFLLSSLFATYYIYLQLFRTRLN